VYFIPTVDLTDYKSITMYKSLAIQLGQHGPQFISPIITKNTTCQTCKEQYGPMVYQVGHTTVTQHKLGCNSAHLYCTYQPEENIHNNYYMQASCTGYSLADHTRGSGYATVPYLTLNYFMYMRCGSCGAQITDGLLRYAHPTEELDIEASTYLPVCSTCSIAHNVYNEISPLWTIHYHPELERPVINFRKREVLVECPQ
jgi:hypothetical protein